jgi:hypothetical protein
MTLNGFGPVFCIVRRNQLKLQLRSYRCRKQECGGFCVSVWCFLVINVYNHGDHYETPYIKRKYCDLYTSIYECMGCLAISFLSMSKGLACCINPQPGGPGDFWSRFSSSSPWYASIRLSGSSVSFGPPRVFYFPGTRHIWWAFPYPPPGEAPDERLATPGERR